MSTRADQQVLSSAFAAHSRRFFIESDLSQTPHDWPQEAEPAARAPSLSQVSVLACSCSSNIRGEYVGVSVGKGGPNPIRYVNV